MMLIWGLCVQTLFMWFTPLMNNDRRSEVCNYLSLGPDLPVQQHIWKKPDILHHSQGLSVQTELSIIPHNDDRSAATSIQESL